jgi:hypothetical protein
MPHTPHHTTHITPAGGAPLAAVRRLLLQPADSRSTRLPEPAWRTRVAPPPPPPFLWEQDTALNLSYFNWAAFGNPTPPAAPPASPPAAPLATRNVYFAPYSGVVARRRVVEYRIGYFGPAVALGHASWAAAPFGDVSGVDGAAAAGVRRLPFTNVAPTTPNLVPLSSLTSNASVQAWTPLPSTYAHVALSPLPAQPDVSAAEFRVSYGMPSACLVSPTFSLPPPGRAAFVLGRITVASSPKPFPNTNTTAFTVQLLPATSEVQLDGSVRQSDDGLSAGVTLFSDGTTQQATTSEFALPLPPPGPPSNWSLAVCVGSYAASPLFLANVSLALAAGDPETPASRPERVFTNWTPAPASANLTGSLWVDLVAPYPAARAGEGPAPYRCSLPLAPFAAVVLRNVGADPQPC